MHVADGRGSVLLWLHYDILCNSGFVDDIMFSHDGPKSRQAAIEHDHGVTADIPSILEVLIISGAPWARSAVCNCPVGSESRLCCLILNREVSVSGYGRVCCGELTIE